MREEKYITVRKRNRERDKKRKRKEEKMGKSKRGTHVEVTKGN